MKIICLGDSLTFGYGVNPDESWFAKVSAQISTVLLQNRGVPGNTTAEMLQRFANDIAQDRPAQVLIMGGTNDIMLNFEIGDIIGRIHSIITLALANQIKPVILIPPLINSQIRHKQWFKDTDYLLANQRFATYRNALIDLCIAANLTYIDLLTAVMDMTGQNSDNPYYLEDGIHLNAEVHQLISTKISDYLLSADCIS